MNLLLNFTKDELLQYVLAAQQEKFRASQIWEWVYQKGKTNFQEMSNLNPALKNFMSAEFTLRCIKTTKALISIDGTRKWLLQLPDNNEIETVFIPDLPQDGSNDNNEHKRQRGTICISSQVGCTLTCKFCHTGTQPLVRNLTSGEILEQVLYVKDVLDDWPVGKHMPIVTNIVLMGMGEPLLNYGNVVTAITTMMDPKGLNLSKHKITLSTSGIVPNIKKCAVDLGINLAVSLHAVEDEVRDQLVPINKKYPIAELISACKEYATRTANKRITFEYVMLKGVNDSIDDAKKLVNLISGLPAKINLIPFNPWPNSSFECSTIDNIKKFANVVEKAGYISPIRSPRGQDIMAACGQLKSSSIKIKKSCS